LLDVGVAMLELEDLQCAVGLGEGFARVVVYLDLAVVGLIACWRWPKND
jgi:hypothetical protein